MWIWLKVVMVHETFYLSFGNSTEECQYIVAELLKERMLNK